jgi:D-3-phosphoglycerate dehydrogenase
MLNRVNGIFSARGVNVGAQYLQTDPSVGYVVIDIDDSAVDAEELLGELRALPGTIRARLLYTRT